MKTNIFFVLTILLLLSACATSSPITTQLPNEPATNETPSSNIPGNGDYIPGPADHQLAQGPVFLDSVELLTLESFPLQFMLALKGNMPTPCNKLRIDTSQPDNENKVIVNVYSVSNPDEMCAQVLEPFDVNFPLGSYPEGHYTLWVNDELITEFDG